MKTRLLLTFILCAAATLVFAQKGVISGKVKDKSTGEDAIGANVVIEGTTTGSTTDVSGNFSFSVEPGRYDVAVTYIGFQKMVIESLEVKPGEEVNLMLQLDPTDEVLQEVVVQGTADRSSESILLVERKNAIQFVQNIGAAELERKGIGNAEAAVTQVTGVSKQEGVKNVFVRGLGDRYNSTSLNNMPLPSEDPQFKNITLDFFSSDIINSIDVNKTFGTHIFGDVAGANVNISSKTLFEDRELKISASAGVNSQTASRDFFRADGANFFGTARRNHPITSLDNYDFSDSFQPHKVSGPLTNLNFSISGGKNFSLGNGALKTFFVATMTNDYSFKNGTVRQVNPVGGIRQDLRYNKWDYNAAQVALGTVLYEFGKGNSIWYNTIYIHDNKQSVGDYEGFSVNGIDDISNPNAYKSFIRRQQQNNNNLLVNQLITSLNLTNQLTLDLATSFNTARGDEPDRRSNFYTFDGEQHHINTNSPAVNHRFFSALKEREVAGNASLAYRLSPTSGNKIMVGYNYRNTSRNFESTQFNFDFNVDNVVQINDPDALFNQESINNNTFEMETGRGTSSKALNPFTYSGDRVIHAGYVDFAFDITKSLSVNAGGRYEMIRQEVGWDTNLDEDNPNLPNDNLHTVEPSYFLPSLTIRYKLTEDNILRAGLSKSYTMPQFKELAPFYYEDVNFSSFGNPFLKMAENLNIDLRYEHYFSKKEFVALTGFYKKIKNAINRVQVNSAANELSYVNTGDADAAGIELEFRKRLLKSDKKMNASSLDLGVNVSYLYSRQELLDDPDDNLTFLPHNTTAALEGASPWLINSDITYSLEGDRGKSLMTALVLNYYSDRIYSIGAPTGNQHIYEVGIPQLDFISKLGLSEKVSLSLNVRNILNPDYNLTKKIESGQTEIISNFKKGITTSIGFSYKF